MWIYLTSHMCLCVLLIKVVMYHSLSHNIQHHHFHRKSWTSILCLGWRNMKWGEGSSLAQISHNNFIVLVWGVPIIEHGKCTNTFKLHCKLIRTLRSSPWIRVIWNIGMKNITTINVLRGGIVKNSTHTKLHCRRSHKGFPLRRTLFSHQFSISFFLHLRLHFLSFFGKSRMSI